MSKRGGTKLRICRRYEEDVWGDVVFWKRGPTRVRKFLWTSILEERYNREQARHAEYMEKKAYERRLRERQMARHKKYIPFNKLKPHQKKALIARTKREMQRQRNEKVFIKPFDQNQTHIKIGSSRLFLYRIDIGKPGRKRIKRNRHFLILMARLKIRRFCNQMTLRTLRRYVKQAENNAFATSTFLYLLESRIDFLLYRMNLMYGLEAYTFRQRINHKKYVVLVNGKASNIPSTTRVRRLGECVQVHPDLRRFFGVKLFHKFLKGRVFMSTPRYLEISYRLLLVFFYRVPSRREVFFPCNISYLVSRLPSMTARFFNNS